MFSMGTVWRHLPDQVLILPRWPKTGHLEDKDAVVVKEIVHLAKEGIVTAKTNVLQGNVNKEKAVDANN